MHVRALAVLVSAAVAGLGGALVDCGGGLTAGAPDASTDATTTTDGPVADAPASDGGGGCEGFAPCDAGDAHVAFVVCPATPPAAGSACAVPGEQCEYGPSWWLACDRVLRCAQGVWTDASGGGACPSYDASAGACPASWDAASAVDASAGLCPAADCDYPEGYCECVSNCGGGGQDPVPGDWRCQPASDGCPVPRPRLGTACTGTAQCTYGWSCGCGQAQQCIGGVWQGSVLPPCP